jgi:hypothetical protein
MEIGQAREAEWGGETHDIVDVTGIFFGRVSKSENRQGFLLRMALSDEDVGKEEELVIGKPYMFRGSFNPNKKKIYLARDGRFSEGESKHSPGFEKVVMMAKEDSVPLAKLMDMDRDGNYVYHKQDIVFSGIVGEVREVGQDGKAIMEISQIGSDPISVWPPDSLTVTEKWEGVEVFGFGYHSIKDNGPSISAKALLPVSDDE